MDPTEVAMINDGSRGADWETVKQYRIDNMYQNPDTQSLQVVLAAGKAAMDWDSKWHLPGTKKLPNGKMHGLGFMSVNSWHGFNNMRTGCKVTLRSGKAYIHGAWSDMGVDAAKTRALTLAASSGLKYEDIVCRHFNDELGWYTHSEPGGSFATENNTGQFFIVGLDIKKDILERAVAPRTQNRPPLFPDTMVDELDIKDSVVFKKANPQEKMTVEEIMGTTRVSYEPTVPARAIGYTYLMARQAHFIEIEVDTDTGEIEVTKAVAVNDVGTVMNPDACNGQQYGGAIMGIGKSLTEEMYRDPATGLMLNDNLIGYPVLTMLDVGPIECLLPETRSGNNCFGLTGIGESIGCTFSAITAAAIYNATGKWVTHIPTTPDVVLKALGKA
jgi:xanthine dehydrogenase molybdenum-binding subunit